MTEKAVIEDNAAKRELRFDKETLHSPRPLGKKCWNLRQLSYARNPVAQCLTVEINKIMVRRLWGTPFPSVWVTLLIDSLPAIGKMILLR